MALYVHLGVSIYNLFIQNHSSKPAQRDRGVRSDVVTNRELASKPDDLRFPPAFTVRSS
jgi:hypothetical protein